MEISIWKSLKLWPEVCLGILVTICADVHLLFQKASKCPAAASDPLPAGPKQEGPGEVQQVLWGLRALHAGGHRYHPGTGRKGAALDTLLPAQQAFKERSPHQLVCRSAGRHRQAAEVRVVRFAGRPADQPDGVWIPHEGWHTQHLLPVCPQQTSGRALAVFWGHEEERHGGGRHNERLKMFSCSERPDEG